MCFIETNTCGPGSDPRSAAPESRGKRTAYWERSKAPASEDPPRSTLPLRIPKRSFFPRKELVLTPPLFLKTFGFQKKILYVVLASRIFLQSAFPIHVFLPKATHGSFNGTCYQGKHPLKTVIISCAVLSSLNVPIKQMNKWKLSVVNWPAQKSSIS